jgi:hypothetical protein
LVRYQFSQQQKDGLRWLSISTEGLQLLETIPFLFAAAKSK